MRAREFIITEAGAATLAAPALDVVTKPVTGAVKQVAKSAFDKGTKVLDKASDIQGYAQGANIGNNGTYTGVGDFALDQAKSAAIGHALTKGGEIAAKSSIPVVAKYVAPAAKFTGNVVKTGTGLTGTGVALALHSKDLGPEVPKWGPQKGNEINRDTGRPWTSAELEKYNTDVPDDRTLWQKITN